MTHRSHRCAGKVAFIALAAIVLCLVGMKRPALAETESSQRVIVVYSEPQEPVGSGLSIQSVAELPEGVESLETIATQEGGETHAAVATLQKEQNVQEVIADLEAMPGVAYAQPDYAYKPSATGGIYALRKTLSPSDTFFALESTRYESPLALKRSNFETAWATLDIISNLTATSEVAVLDTGCQTNHPDLRNVIDSTYAYNAVTKGSLLGDTGSAEYSGHGTHVCGIVGAQVNNGGVAGAAWTTPGGTNVLPVNVFGSNNVAYTSTIQAGLDYIDGLVTSGKVKNLHVVNLSLGAVGVDDRYLHEAIQRLRSHGVLCVCAAGNENTNSFFGPGDYDECLSVMALDRNGSRWVGDNGLGSNYGSRKDISAVGQYYYSSVTGSTYGYKSGTSMASPVVAGAAALLWKANPDLSVNEVVSALVTTTTPATGSAGELNVAKAIQRVTRFTPSDPVRVGDVEQRVDLHYGNLRPEPSVTIGNTTLVKDRDYTLSYSYTMSGNQVMEGPASVVVRGRSSATGGGFTGTATVGFVVTNDFREAIVEAEDTFYTGHSASPRVTLSVTNSGTRTTLVQGEDFEVRCSDVNVGPATCTILGKGAYTGQIEGISFTIKPVDITNANTGVAGAPRVMLTNTKYSSTYAKPQVLVFLDNGACITEQADFHIQSKNIEAGNAKADITGTGSNVYGSVLDVPFRIEPAPLSWVTFTVNPQTYTGKQLKPEPVSAAYNGVYVSSDAYQVTGYGANISAVDGGTLTVLADSTNFVGTAEVPFAINPVELSNCNPRVSALDVSYTGYEAQPGVAVVVGEKTILTQGVDYTVSTNAKDVGEGVVTVTGRGNYAGSEQATFEITPASITAARISIDNQVFSGGAIMPKINATWLSLPLTLGKDYRVSAWRNNTQPGTAYVEIQGINNFEGSATGRFQIQSKESATVGTTTTKWNISVTTQPMYRMYNPNSGEHFYTKNTGERDSLKSAGWNYEGIGWNAPTMSKTPVHRLYNPHTGDHHYTTSAGERDALVAVGWKSEGVGWYSNTAKATPLWREYNPNASVGSHNYTTSSAEHKQLCAMGWKDEGVGWYGQ